MNNCNNCKYRFKEKNLTPCRICKADGDFGWWEHFDTRFVTEEIEKIWEEIRALPDINPDYQMDRTIHISRYGVQEIIYKHISELKGENNADG